jgi:hypothetical protein
LVSQEADGHDDRRDVMATRHGWFDEFPDRITAEDYAKMPEEFSRTEGPSAARSA